jgi:hypothetical protein
MKRRASAFLVVPVLALVFASSAAASWSLQTGPNPGNTVNEFRDVSCPTATNCEAVGRYVASGKSTGLLSGWNGTSWWNAINPGWKPDYTEDVSCVSGTWCMAVGFTTEFPPGYPASYRWKGSSWEELKMPPVTNETVPKGISCLSTTNCVAVGRMGNIPFTNPLAYSWNGTQWTNVAVPKPAGYSELSDVSCASGICTAVGQYESSGVIKTLVETWNGSEWKIVSSPNVTGSTVSSLADVSCSSATACTAVGRSVDFTTGATSPLVMRWNGTSWTIQSAPSSGEGTELSGVSCPTSTSCTAVGSYKSGSAKIPTALSWNGASWTVQTVANPTPPAGSVLQGHFAGISCTSSTVCTAVGRYQFVTGGVAGKMFTLVERQS